jgi:hypothetical protein
VSVHAITTVTAAASTQDLVTLAIVKDELGVGPSVSTYDAQIGRYISAASAAAANYCNRVFPLETLSEVFNIMRARLQFGGEKILQTSRYPIGSIASVTEDGTALVANTDYQVDKTTGQLFRLDAGTGLISMWNQSPVTVVYDAGYATIPLDVQDAVTRMVKARWFAKGRDPYTRSENIPGVRDVSYWVPTGDEAGNMSPDVADILDNYRSVPLE